MPIPAATSVDARAPRRPAVPFVARAQSMLAAAAARDPLAMDLRAASVAARGSQILQILTRAATTSASPSASVDAALAREWNVGSRGVDILRAALVLCADHELNVSVFHRAMRGVCGLASLRGRDRRAGRARRAEARRRQRACRIDARLDAASPSLAERDSGTAASWRIDRRLRSPVVPRWRPARTGAAGSPGRALCRVR